jgi:hypothetical protein
MIRLGAVLAVLALSAPAAAQPLPFEGKWAVELDGCKAGASVPDRMRPITLTRRKVTTPFMTCDFTSVKPGGASWRVEAACTATATKEKGRESFGFALIGDLLHWSWGADTATFRRCPT